MVDIVVDDVVDDVNELVIEYLSNDDEQIEVVLADESAEKMDHYYVEIVYANEIDCLSDGFDSRSAFDCIAIENSDLVVR